MLLVTQIRQCSFAMELDAAVVSDSLLMCQNLFKAPFYAFQQRVILFIRTCVQHSLAIEVTFYIVAYKGERLSGPVWTVLSVVALFGFI